MSYFDRRFPVNAMCALKRLSSKRAGWWPDLLSSWAPSGSPGVLRLAIRNGYMNFYSKGQSIARIDFDGHSASPTMHIHEKYVKNVPTEDRYISRLPTTKGVMRMAAWFLGAALKCSRNGQKTLANTVEKKSAVSRLWFKNRPR